MKDNFTKAIEKANEACKKHLFYPEVDSGKKLEEILLTLESMFSSDLEHYLKTQKLWDKFETLKEEVLKTLKDKELTYSLIPETNRFFIKQKGVIIKNVQFQNIDQILLNTLGITQEDSNFYFLKV